MKIADNNLLIVEDDQEWRSIYTRAATRLSMNTIRIAGSLKEAHRILDELKFSVAFVDIGLDVADDRNIDGLRVMEDIRARGDETSIIVVTGRSGRDVLPITRDAIKKYDAFDTVGKVPIEPKDIAGLLEAGRDAYRKAAAANRIRVYHVLRGSIPAWDWDYRMLRATRISGGTSRLHEFLDELFEDFLPVVARDREELIRLDVKVPVAFGEYWSRAIGSAVFICFGDGKYVDEVIESRGTDHRVLERFDVGNVLRQKSAGSVKGFVFAMNQERRERFG